MDIPEILQGEVHLPLAEHMSSAEAIALANAFYQTQLGVEDFQESQAILSNGRILLDLLDRATGDVVITFVNKARVAEQVDEEDIVLFNALGEAAPNIEYLAPPLRLLDKLEMAFLDDLGSGNTCPYMGGDDFPWKLSQLLNSHNLLGGWTSGTMGYRCTGEFTLVYKGSVEDAPQQFIVPEGSEVAILRMNHGEDKGYLCLIS